ncbi:hypothetical protein [Amnibacterium endophyticum]|uniref:Uncharacterized protein n=1 Tax=Amnibacterium endophyticum TaxID=2109337 RepID=A0ABW4LFD5_9MICO
MSDERPPGEPDQQDETVPAERVGPGPEHERVAGDAASAPAAQPRESTGSTSA